MAPIDVAPSFSRRLAAGARSLGLLAAARARRRGEAVTERAPFELDALLAALARHDVRYVLIGGVAMNIYDERGLTDDLDACYEQTRVNCRRLAGALAELGARRRDWPAELPDVLDDQVLMSQSTLTLTTPHGALDLLAQPSGIEGGFETLASDAETVRIGAVDVLVASPRALLAMKRAAGRALDRADIAVLEQLLEAGREAMAGSSIQQQQPPAVRWEDLEDRADRCPRCLHWWVSHGVPTEDGYGCGIPTSSMDERERGIYEICGCIFAEGNTVTPRQVRILPDKR